MTAPNFENRTVSFKNPLSTVKIIPSREMEEKFDMWTPASPMSSSTVKGVTVEEEVKKISPIIKGLFLSGHNSVKNYKDFDLIINCDWPCNGVKLGEVRIKEYKYPVESVTPGYPENPQEKESLGKSIGKLIIISIGVNDTTTENISKYFDMVGSYILTTIRIGKKVLVHCHMGVSRSASLIIAFLMRFSNSTTDPISSENPKITSLSINLSFEEAFSIVKNKRFIVNINPGFIDQLRKYSL